MSVSAFFRRSILAVALLAPPAGAQVPAPCTADFNNTGTTSVQDIFDFLAAWFEGDPRADINGNGSMSVQDIFDLLNAWFAGCPVFAGNPNPHDMGYAALGMPGCHQTMTAMSGMTSGIASGVHLFSGETVRTEVDVRIPGRGFDFVLARTYRSQQGELNGLLAQRWDFSYNIHVRASGANLILHDGSLAREDLYTLQPDNSWTNPEFFRRMVRNPDMSFTVELADGTHWNLNPIGSSTGAGRLASIVDRNANAMTFTYTSTEIIYVDTLGRTGSFDICPFVGNLPTITKFIDHSGRMFLYDHYDGVEPGGAHGDLKSVTTPPITGTPNGNDFPLGKTTVYTYTAGGSRHELNHRLLTVTDGRGQTFLRNEYTPTTDIADPSFGRLTRQTWGNIGDVIDLVYVPQTPAAGNNFASRLTIVNDRVGNVKECLYDAANRGVMLRELNGRADPDQPTTETANRPGAPLRSGDPVQNLTKWTYAPSGVVSRIDHPNGNSTINTYDLMNPDWLARGNLMQRQSVPGVLGGDQPSITESWQYLGGFGGCGCGGAQFVTQHTDERGNITAHTYDARGNRLHTTHRIPSIIEDWEYNAFGQVTAHIHPDNGSGHRRRDEYTYYSSGIQAGYLQSTIIDAGAGGFQLTTSNEYNLRGHLIRQIDPCGDDTLWTRNQLDQVVRRSSAQVNTTSGLVRYDTDYRFDAANNLIGVDVENTDADGVLQANAAFTTSNEYDVLDRLTRRTREATDTHDVIEEYQYDANGNRTLTRFGEAVNANDARNTVARSYDERNLTLDITRAPGAPVSFRNVTRYHYDGNRNVERVRRGINGVQRLTLFTRDGYNRLLTTTDPMGNVSTNHYDAAGNLTSVRSDGELTDVAGSATNVRLSEATHTYDAMNRRTRTDRAFFNPSTQAAIGDGAGTTRWTYAANSALLTTIDDNNRTSSRVYDRASRVSVITDARGNTRTHSYDSDSRITVLTCVDLSDLTLLLQSFTDAYTYDALNRRTSATDNAGSVTQYRYDSRNNPTAMIDGRGSRTEYAYDGLNRRIRSGIDMDGDGDTLDAADIVTTQAWDDSSRLTAQTDDNGNATRYAYDAMDRRIAIQMADGTLEQVGQGAVWPLGPATPNLTGFTSGYDIHGNAITTRDANGTVTSHQYDLNNRLTRRDVTVGAGVSSQTTFETYQYDGLSRAIIATDDDSTVTFSYDSLSHSTAESLNGLTTSRTFDGEGNELSLTYPGGRVINRTFDALDRVDVITDGATPVANFAYAGAHRVEAIDFGNGLRQSFTYDGITGVPNPAGDFGVRRMIGSTVAPIGGGTALETMSYTYDRAGNTTGRVVVGTATDEDYQYDAANRLTRTDRASAPLLTTYALDGVGNRATVGGDLDAGPYTLNATLPAPADSQVNQYTSTPFDARAYDANGNLAVTTPTVPAGPPRMFVYDFRNRLVQYTDPATATSATYKYDALGRRTEKVVATGGPSTMTKFIYAGRREIEERDGANTVIATHVWGDPHTRSANGGLLSTNRSGVTSYFIRDPEGSAVLATNSAGIAHERYAYFDFGAVKLFNGAGQAIPQSVFGSTRLFAVAYLDAESQTFHVGNGRQFDPRTATLISSESTAQGWSDPRDRLEHWRDLLEMFGSGSGLTMDDDWLRLSATGDFMYLPDGQREAEVAIQHILDVIASRMYGWTYVELGASVAAGAVGGALAAAGMSGGVATVHGAAVGGVVGGITYLTFEATKEFGTWASSMRDNSWWWTYGNTLSTFGEATRNTVATYIRVSAEFDFAQNWADSTRLQSSWFAR